MAGLKGKEQQLNMGDTVQAQSTELYLIMSNLRQIEELLRLKEDCREKPESESRWLSMKEACSYAKMSKNILKARIMEGSIKATKKGGKWIVDRRSIDSYYDDSDIDLLVQDLQRR